MERVEVPSQYGVPTRFLEWDVVERRLADAHHYWLATVRPDGRPHVVPLDGVWLDGAWYFGGSSTTVRHRNLVANRRVAMHLEDAAGATIVEGECAVTKPSSETANALVAASKAKYGYSVPVEVYLGGVWCLEPTRVLAWSNFTEDATRFAFG